MIFIVYDTGKVDLVIKGSGGFQHRIDVTRLIDDNPSPGEYSVSVINISDCRITLSKEENE